MSQSVAISKITKFLGLGFLTTLKDLFTGKLEKEDFKKFLLKVVVPITSILLFIGLWHLGAKSLHDIEANFKIEKALNEQGPEAAEALRVCIASGDISCQPNTLPSPTQVWESYQSLLRDHKIIKADKAAFIEKTADLNAKRLAQGEAPIVYTGRPSFVDQIIMSLKTVFAGFLLALIIAVPIGILIGLSPTLKSAFNWFIQIFKPVSPVVWYLLVFMIVKTILIDSSDDSSFIISFISVGLCSMWATLVNTAMGVASVDKDYINVAKVLKLGPVQKIFKVVLPSSLPLIFTGLKITLSVAWMVLIAIELLAQSPGLGLFVWEEFQNGANDSNSKIIVAMFVIGIIGFLLDRIMLTIQNLVSFNKNDGI
ncbi:ABC transporter permease [Siansivirga zeaxanthinifaciens]|uniref:Nitrate ABC transporter permease n=1 Tax=Siansivirga zeaxanthinifaciens CC-SAMT-1 TaxID=1454006 RepID=A0A0C5WFZ0_9FLAO|nr:ABC transporter permease subunit [Siansivirga zeaxanthinifaciens]AJR04099.1 nitrate ABC transporter permease [Siansivirga zeaxanthinifaciens CC-SAMT-1]